MPTCIGCGLMVDPDTGLLKVQTKPGGGIECDNNAGGGIHIVAGSTSVISDLSNTIALSGNGSSGDHLSAAVRKSSAACNGLRVTDADGVWAPLSCTVANNTNRGYFGTNLGTPPYTSLNTAGAATFTIESFGGPISVVNPTDCTLLGLWNVQAFGGTVLGDPGFDAYAYVTINTTSNGGPPSGWVTSTPITYFRMDNRASSPGHPNAGVVAYGINNMWEENFVSFAPNATNTIYARVNIKVTAGTGTWLDQPFNPGFEFHWHVTPQGVC